MTVFRVCNDGNNNLAPLYNPTLSIPMKNQLIRCGAEPIGDLTDGDIDCMNRAIAVKGVAGMYAFSHLGMMCRIRHQEIGNGEFGKYIVAISSIYGGLGGGEWTVFCDDVSFERGEFLNLKMEREGKLVGYFFLDFAITDDVLDKLRENRLEHLSPDNEDVVFERMFNEELRKLKEVK